MQHWVGMLQFVVACSTTGYSMVPLSVEACACDMHDAGPLVSCQSLGCTALELGVHPSIQVLQYWVMKGPLKSLQPTASKDEAASYQ